MNKKLFTKTHGMSYTRIYGIWMGIKGRCNNPNSGDYHYYGGRGIAICERWENSFEAFYSDMGENYRDNLTIDRINSNGNYEKDNCRWIPMSNQVFNRRNSIILEYGCCRRSLAQWARTRGMLARTLKSRIRNNWAMSDALFKPVRKIDKG
jgi:hypothetical protein